MDDPLFRIERKYSADASAEELKDLDKDLQQYYIVYTILLVK